MRIGIEQLLSFFGSLVAGIKARLLTFVFQDVGAVLQHTFSACYVVFTQEHSLSVLILGSLLQPKKNIQQTEGKKRISISLRY